MSPYRFGATTTSRSCGDCTRRRAKSSTINCSYFISGYPAAVSSTILRNKPSDSRSMLYLEVQVSLPLPPARLRFNASRQADPAAPPPRALRDHFDHVDAAFGGVERRAQHPARQLERSERFERTLEPEIQVLPGVTYDQRDDSLGMLERTQQA